MTQKVVVLKALFGVMLTVLIVPSSAQDVVLTLAQSVVIEGDTVEVCIELFDKSLITGTASVSLITDDSSTGSTITTSDYVPLKRDYLLTASSPRVQCLLLKTLRDHAIEDTETITISLINNIGINTGPSLHLTINPAPDKIVVGFVQESYTTTEDQRVMNISIILVEGSIETAFPSTVVIQLGLEDVTTEGSRDYTVMANIEFSANDKEGAIKVAQVTIQNDEEVEGTEKFLILIQNSSTVTTNRLSTSNGGVTTVSIVDNDAASVSLLGPEVVSVVEDDEDNNGKNVVICAQLILKNDLPLERSVMILLETKNITSDESDYELERDQLIFQAGTNSSSTTCSNLMTVADKLEEDNETVIISVAPSSPDTVLGLSNITVIIINNDVNCPEIPRPVYPSSVIVNGGLFEGATITYSCAPGYQLVGDNQRQCIGGDWTRKEPLCRVMDCGEPPSLKNGDYSLANTTVNSTAVYFCQDGYQEELDPNQSNKIVCLNTGLWSDLDMQCLADNGEAKGLGGGGAAAITVGLLLIVGVAVVVALTLGLWYYFHSQPRVKRSGKYAVNNSGIEDAGQGKESVSLPVRPYSTVSENDSFLGDTKFTACSPIDV